METGMTVTEIVMEAGRILRRAMVNEDGVTDQDGNKYYWTWTAPDDASGRSHRSV